MNKLIRFGVSLNEKLLKDFDRIIDKKGYPSRSEAIRDLIRASLVSLECEDEKKEVIGTITIVYNHEIRGLLEKLTEEEHRHIKNIITTTHLHLDKDNCLEVLIVRGKPKEIKTLVDKLSSMRGVKHGNLTMTTTGKTLS